MAEPRTAAGLLNTVDVSGVLVQLVNCLQSVEKLAVLTQEAAECIQDLHRKNAEVCVEVRRISSDCLDVAMQYRAYLLEISDFAWYAERNDRKRKVLSALQRRWRGPNYGPMNDYIKQLKRCLRQAARKYETFRSSCRVLIQNLSQVSKDCKENEGAARTKEVATRATGAVLAGGAMAAGIGGTATTAAVGIGLSVAAGVPTLGVGAIIGLVVTAVASPVVGIGVGATVAGVTHYIASVFKEIKVKFQKMDKCSNEIEKCGANLHSGLSAVHVSLDKIDSLMNDVEYSKTHYETQDPLLDALQLLFQRLRQFGFKTTKCQQSLNRNIEALEAANRKVFE